MASRAQLLAGPGAMSRQGRDQPHESSFPKTCSLRSPGGGGPGREAAWGETKAGVILPAKGSSRVAPQPSPAPPALPPAPPRSHGAERGSGSEDRCELAVPVLEVAKNHIRAGSSQFLYLKGGDSYSCFSQVC